MNLNEKASDVARYVRGKKTYIAILGVVATEAAFYSGKITPEQRELGLKVFSAMGAATFCAKINRVAETIRSANNLTLRQAK